MTKVYKKNNVDQVSFHYIDKNEQEIKCIFELVFFRGFYHDAKQPTKKLLYDTFSARKIHRAAMSLTRYEWFVRTITSHDHKKIKIDLFVDRFVRMEQLVTKSENNVQKYYRHNEFVVIDETLRNFFTLYNCDFIVYKISQGIIDFYSAY